MQKTNPSIRMKLVYVFVLLMALVWIDELIDFPGIFYGVEKSPVNWLEAIIETVLIAMVGFLTISWFIPQKGAYKELKRTRHILISIIVSFLGLCLVIWLNELIDIPYLLLGGEKTPVNIYEAVVETILIIIIGFFAVAVLMLNISERARAQDLFYKSFYFNPIPAAITTISDGIVIQANEAFYNVTGYKADDIIGKSLLKHNIWVHPEQRDKVVQTVLKKGSVRNLEVELRDSAGNLRTFLFSAETITYLDEPHILSMAIDITDRKKAKDLLIETEAKYRNMFLHSINGIVAYKTISDGADFIFADINTAAERIDNIKKEDVLGKSVLEVFPSIKEFGLFDVFQRVYKTGKSEHFPISLYKDAHVEGWRENFVYKLPSGDIVAVYSDETARKIAEQELEERQRALMTLMGNLPGMAYRCRNDRDWTMEFISEGSYLLTGYSPYDLIGNKVIPYGEVIHPDDRDMVWESVQAGLKEKKHFQMDYRIITADGRERWVWEQGIGIFNQQGDLVALEGFIADTTAQKRAQQELRRSEEKFSKAFHASPDWISISTLKDGIYIDVNEAFMEHSGFSIEEVIGRSSLELGIWEHKEDRDIVKQKIREHGGISNEEVNFRTKQGTILTMLWSAEMFEFGGEECILSVSRDITDRKNMEEQLKHSQKQLRDLYKNLQETREAERTRISREIHDDLGQELTGLKLEVAFLKRKLPRDSTDLIDKTSQISDHIDLAVESVRRISMDLRPALLDQLGLVAAIEWQADDFQKRTGIVCTLSIDPEITLKSTKLSTTIFRIFQETLTNITRHAHASRVSVSLHQVDGSIDLLVKDNGKGIEKEEIANPKSFGIIGMKERVSDWGGDIQISGKRGKGTTVKVRIPINSTSSQ
ncbi:MAG TPA: PAS domain S-box protein [Deltaproteobacteria bacterium]|nr:PAS domain S-box protein [Deltaproteobacteria bacterium]